MASAIQISNDRRFLFSRRWERPLRTLNPSSCPHWQHTSGRAAMSIAVKSGLASVLQAFGYGASLRSRGLILTGSRSSFLRQMVKPFFRGSREKWLSAFKIDKMVTRGRLSIHLQEAPQLSKEWGEGHAQSWAKQFRVLKAKEKNR